MKIDPSDPVWTHEQADVISILQRKRDYYLMQNRVANAHGIAAALILVASVFLEHKLDIDVTDFGELE
jgi:hypothetical protein